MDCFLENIAPTIILETSPLDIEHQTTLRDFIGRSQIWASVILDFNNASTNQDTVSPNPHTTDLPIPFLGPSI